MADSSAQNGMFFDLTMDYNSFCYEFKYAIHYRDETYRFNVTQKEFWVIGSEAYKHYLSIDYVDHHGLVISTPLENPLYFSCSIRTSNMVAFKYYQDASVTVDRKDLLALLYPKHSNIKHIRLYMESDKKLKFQLIPYTRKEVEKIILGQ